MQTRGAVEPMTNAIVPATAAHEARIVQALCAAFDADPMFDWSLRQGAGRARAAQLAFENMLRMYRPHGMSYTTAGGAAAALWAPHDRWAPALWRELLLLPTYLRCTGAARFSRVVRGFDALRKHHPKEPHYYLFVLGVEPAAQRQGLGSLLLRNMTERCDREGMPAYLEATTRHNRALYQRHGFAAGDEFAFGPGGPALCPMWRPPRGHNG